MKRQFEAIVVGAGPAGAAAALIMAKGGVDVALLERGNFPGEKNMFGGMLHKMPSLEEHFDEYWNQAPLERHVSKKATIFMTDDAHVNVCMDWEDFDKPPYNGYTVFRPRWDNWLAQEAVKAGATLINRCTVTDLIVKNGKVVGVQTLRDNGEIYAPVVVSAEGVLSFLADKMGMRKKFNPAKMAVGCKCLIDMPKQMIDDRFGLVRDQGVAYEYVGVSMGVRGGVALYTNRDSVSVNMVCHIGSLGKSGITLYDMMNNYLEQPQMKKLLNGGRLSEYSAHAIPEGGYEMIPQLVADGFLITGDAAAFCNATGINLEGINMATHSGILAGKAVIAAKQNNDYSKGSLDLYRKLIEDSYVYKDLKTFKRAPGLLHDDRIFQKYPDFALDMIKKIYHITGEPKKNMTMLVLDHVFNNGKVSIMDLISTVWTAWRAL